ncbi:MAG: AAA family ATPase [Xenococcus sp. (in: cyanobacteria)]
MRLISLQLCNFRQFYGKTPEIKFSSGQENTTVIYGNNGSGKTAILNAFTWILYEQFTAAFAAPESLINKRAIAESRIDTAIECWGEIKFEREHKLYQLKRKCYGIKKTNQELETSESKLFILVSQDDGKWYSPVESAADIIELILPSSLHQYFFFDGERIDNFFRRHANNTIAEDTRELLGVKVLDRALEHLKKAKRSLEEELQNIGDSETKQLLQTQNKLEDSISRSQIKTKEIIQQIKNLENQKKNLTHQLQELNGADKLQYLKNKLLKQEQSTRSNLVNCKKELKNLISRQSYLVFLPQPQREFTKLLQNLRQSKNIYTNLKKDFIEQLLQQEKCICNRPLIPETTAYRELTEILKQVDDQHINEAAIRLETQIQINQNLLTKLWQELDQKQAYLNNQYLELSKIEQELEKVNKKLRRYPDHNIQKLQQDIEDIEDKIKELILEQGIIQQSLTHQNQELSQLEIKINKHQLKENKQILTKKRIQATTEAITRLIEVRTRLERQFRKSLEQKVGEIFSSISFTPYIPKLDQNYELTLVENSSGNSIQVAASTGENQILSLSFIGGIINRVREWSQQKTLIGPDSSTFPIVMDSPFGSLDQIYRQQVAKAIPQLANQLIILVTQTQWRGEVATEIDQLTGTKYVLAYNSPKSDCQRDCINLYGVDYPLVKPSNNQFEYTEIIPVNKQ